MPISSRLIIAGVAAALVSACAVGPDFKPPPPPQTAGFVPPGALPDSTAAAALPGGEAQRFVDGLDIPGQWWTLFRSPDLNALIERALKNSPTLAAAQATLRNANETTAAERGSFFPSVSGTYEGERAKSSGAAFGVPALGSSLYTLNEATVSVAYTLDAFGGVRRQVESLSAQAEYERFALEASYLSLTANIVTAAVSEASLRAQIAATEDIARSQQAQLDITQRRLNAGGASRADVLQQLSTLQGTLASLPPLRSQLAQERNQLAVYVGALPADYAGAGITLDSLTLPADLPVSVPSRFVEQRPDVRQYSALLHEATAQIGVATANMLPQLSLSASYGGAAGKFSGLFDSSSVIYTLIGQVTQPIFKGGTLLHQRRAAIAAAQEAAANYRATVITAFQNVSNTLYALQGDADALVAETTAERTAAESLKLVQVQYKSGAASYLSVLTAEQTYQNAAVALVKARAQRYADTAALFQALGGGWWNRTDLAANSSEKGPL
jgi:NodT family efflux transporter outer membrane factor (OMF) lipoprotein